jgi:hypothetical protein
VQNQALLAYEIEIQGVGTFVTSGTSYTVSGTLGVGTTYNWRVRAQGAVTSWGAWSAWQGFTTLAASIGAPTITSPANGQAGLQPSGTITWSAPSVVVGQNITNYRIHIPNVVYQELGNVNYNYSGLALNANYSVSVEAYGGVTGWGPAATHSFTTVALSQTVWDYTTPGNHNFTVPVTGSYLLMAAGGGGGGAATESSSSSGEAVAGGSGAAAYSVRNLVVGQQMSVVVGGGGPGAIGYEYGGSATSSGGGTSSIGTLVSAGGGSGAAASNSTQSGGSGGTGYGDVAQNGNNGPAPDGYTSNGRAAGVSVSYSGHSITSGYGGAAHTDTQWVEDGGAGSCKIAWLG